MNNTTPRDRIKDKTATVAVATGSYQTICDEKRKNQTTQGLLTKGS